LMEENPQLRNSEELQKLLSKEKYQAQIQVDASK
jgi:hypothetical protein